MKPLDALRSLGSGSEPPAQTKQRVYGAVLAALDVAAASAAATAAPKLPTTLSPPATPLLASLASSKALTVAALIWLMGGATGAALFGLLRPQALRVIYVDRPLLASTASEPAKEREPAPAFAPLASASPTSNLVTAHPVAANSPSSAGSQLAAERALLDLARANAARGEPGRVLELVERHRGQFLHGRLAEEREALAIRALHSLGRDDEARARADAFRATYPHSFLTPVIDSALSAP